MIAVITGDIMNSRNIPSSSIWMDPLKSLFREYGESPYTWEIFRGDSFQLEIRHPEMAYHVALRIKATVLSTPNTERRHAPINVRLSIGFGTVSYRTDRITEGNGDVFIRSGQGIDRMKKLKQSIIINTGESQLDSELNLYLKLAGLSIDSWTISSAEAMNLVLKNPDFNQTQLGKALGIEQNSVSKRLAIAHADEILEVNHMFAHKIKALL
ncbi:MAG TPA: hypothetical protein DDX92_03535 [Flavobacteriales bacterium]|jgi:hypothetical protein|nr:hypothetical protein [Flavobacteriales bacterium]